jgi:two-component SAPR family response regulator
MKIVNVIIIGKCEIDNKVIETILKEQAPLYKVISIITNNENIEKTIEINKPDVVFIDFSFENIQVSNILNYLSENNIIFVLLIKTNTEAIHAFKTNALLCLIKPLTHEKVAIAVNKIYKKTIQQFYF